MSLLKEFNGWVESLDDEELTTYRYELYARAEIADSSSHTYMFAEAALKVMCAHERRRALQRELNFACEMAAPDVDPEAFTEALFILARAQRQLDSDPDAAGVFAGALEVAERRAEARRSEQNSTDEEG